MIYRIYPSKDATLYEDTPRKEQNTGKDEILEIGKFYDTDNTSLLGNSRVLLEFDLTSISQSIVSNDITIFSNYTNLRLLLHFSFGHIKCQRHFVAKPRVACGYPRNVCSDKIQP